MNPARSLVHRLFSRPRMMQLVMWPAAALLPAASAAAQQGGTITATAAVQNHAVATVALPGGGVATSRDSATVAVSYIVGVRLGAGGTAAVRPGGSVVLAHRLDNTGMRPDQITLVTTILTGWSVSLYVDVDRDGAIGAADSVATVVSVAPGGSLQLLARVTAPADAADSSSATLRLNARSGNAAAATAEAEDVVTVVGPQPALRLEKAASRPGAAHGDTIAFTLTVRNDGDAPADTATIVDSLPAGMQYVAGSLAHDGTSLSDAAAIGSGGRTVIRVPAAALAAGSLTVVSFRVVIATGASGDSLVNVAAVTQSGMPAATDSAGLAIRMADLGLEKVVFGDTIVALGGELTYRLRATNRSGETTAYDVVLVDTLPDALQLVTAAASPEVTGQVLTWRVPSLAPGESFTRDLTARIVRATAEPVVNRASLGALNAAASSGAVARAVLDRTPGAALGIGKRAGVLEVGLGEAVPYVLAVRNRSPLPLSGVVVHDLLPDGMVLAGGAVEGADSIRVSGRSVTMFVAGPVPPGEEHVLRYNGVLTSARVRAATNVASASADGGQVLSDTAVAVVRVRRGFEVENRTLVGKVWLDRNDNRRQEPGETGVPGVTVWMSDGVAVVTDREGRFSLRDVPTGQHAMRLDMAKVPQDMRLADSDDDVRIVRADGWTLPAIEFRLVPAPGAKPCACPDTLALPRPPLAVVQQGMGGTAAMSAAERATEELVLGPSVRFTAPGAAAVVHTSRIYVGARGEPNMPVRLLVGDSLVAEGIIRPDGLHDFLNVPLAPGPRVLRLWTRNSWGNERWDTLHVHRSGPAAAFALETDAPALHPDERSERPVRVRVLDQWGMPVAEGVQVTVEATGATLEGEDTDRASLGAQRTVMKDGWIGIGLRGGATTGPASLKLRSGSARGTVAVTVLPQLRPLLLTGSAELGLGSTTPSYGAVSARGALDDRTAVTVAYDSRRPHESDDAFGRVVDPLGAGQYPTLGDGSTQTSHGTGSGMLTARVERDYDWLEFGDIMPRDVTGSRALFDYRRALTGVQGRVALGAVTVHGFGSFTSQQLQERQIAATSGSGPYALGSDLRPGTERIVVEVRARENAARVIDRRELVRVVDYELDHVTGTLLLRRPLASMDAGGNPVYIVAYVERISGEESRFVGGGRAELGVASLLGRGLFDSVAVGVSAVHDATGGATNTVTSAPSGASSALDVVGTDVRLERGTASLELAVLRSEQRDTAAFATRGALAWESADARLSAAAEWTRVAPGFGGGTDPRLASGFRELRLRTGARVGSGARLELAHERQYFEEYGIDRRSTFLRAEQRRGERALSQQLGLQRDGARAGTLQGTTTTGQGRLEASMGDRGSVWIEATRPLAREGASLQPSRLGMGAGYRLFGRTRLETTHFLNQVEDGQDYTTSGVNLRTETPFGGRAWGGVERASAVRASHAALLGIEQRFRLAHGWEVNGMLERRVGLDAAPLEDPARSLPFARPEQDRSLAAFGFSFMPGADRSRLSLRSEFLDGVEQRGFRVTMSGDVPLGSDAAFLARSDWSEAERRLGGGTQSRQDRSLLGYAFRPTRSTALNVLAKLEWRRSLNPLGSASLADSAEARRLIATSDAVWKPLPRTELAARYAVRWADWRYAGIAAPVAPVAHYTGLRGEQAIEGRLGVRVDARMLHEQSSGVATWSLAPSLTWRLSRELRLEAGYRAGTLHDLDFGESRSKLFATVGLHFTERTLGGTAAFWRDRVRDDRQP